jgi:hypothetical protein
VECGVVQRGVLSTLYRSRSTRCAGDLEREEDVETYRLLLAHSGAQHEVLQAGWVKALRRIPIDAQDVVDSLTARAGRLVSTHAGMELDYSLQFCAAVRNPVIQEAVNNAAVNRWGLSE